MKQAGPSGQKGRVSYESREQRRRVEGFEPEIIAFCCEF